MRLAVELHGTRVGQLHGDSRTFDFTAGREGGGKCARWRTITEIEIVHPDDLDPA